MSSEEGEKKQRRRSRRYFGDEEEKEFSDEIPSLLSRWKERESDTVVERSSSVSPTEQNITESVNKWRRSSQDDDRGAPLPSDTGKVSSVMEKWKMLEQGIEPEGKTIPSEKPVSTRKLKSLKRPDPEELAKTGKTETELVLERTRKGASDYDPELSKEIHKKNRLDNERLKKEIEEDRKRIEEKKKKRAEEEKKREEEEKRRLKEMEEKRKSEAEERRKRVEENRKHVAETTGTIKSERNFVTNRSTKAENIARQESDEGDSFQVCNVLMAKVDSKKTEEELEAEKKAVLSERIKPLDNLNGMDVEQLKNKAKELHAVVYNLTLDTITLHEEYNNNSNYIKSLQEKLHQQEKPKLKLLDIPYFLKPQTDINKLSEKFTSPTKVQVSSPFSKSYKNCSIADKIKMFESNK